MATHSTLLKLACKIERIEKKLHIRIGRGSVTLSSLRHLLDIEQQRNLPAAIAFFEKHPSSHVELDKLKGRVEEAQRQLERLNKSAIAPSQDERNIPKIIWMYWNSGLESAPDVVKFAYRNWSAMNPDYELRFLDDRSIRNYLDPELLFTLSSLELTVAHQSDFIRTYLLASIGGVWADSTTFCWQPLSSWIDEETAETGFFIFRQPESRKDRQITNWFIASSPDNPIIRGMFQALCDYLFQPRGITLRMKKPRHYDHYEGISRTGTGYPLLRRMEGEGSYPYFFYHYLFNEVVATGEAKEIWQKVIQGNNRHAKNHGDIGDAYISKQTHKGDYQQSETYRTRKKALLKLIDELQ